VSTSEYAAAALLQAPPRPGYHCGTCGAAFTTQTQVDAHLRHAYHGCQCLACGVVYATSGAFDAHIRWARGPRDQAEPRPGVVYALNAGHRPTR